VFALVNDLGPFSVAAHDVYLHAFFQMNAAPPSHRIGRPAVVEARQCAFMRLRPGWAECRILGQSFSLGRDRLTIGLARERGNCDERDKGNTFAKTERIFRDAEPCKRANRGQADGDYQ
jgi:hypothetical protein